MNVEDKSQCDGCHKDLGQVFMKCAECPNASICPSCFAKGVEFQTHSKRHPYKIIDLGSFSVLEQNWTATEEKSLLEGIEQFGIGNWEDVSCYVEGKNSHELEDHYYKSYIESSDLGYVTVPSKIPNRVTDHAMPLHQIGALTQAKDLDITKEQELQLAYMPYRDDYEMEHDNDAESIVSGLIPNIDDSELDTSLKVARVCIYLDKLRERHKRKVIVQEYHLVEKFFNRNSKDYPKRLFPCLQFMREQQAINLARDFRREQILKTKVKHLKLYRKNGIKKLEDGIVFDVKHRRRTKSKLNLKSSDSAQNEKPFDKLLLEYGCHLLSNDEKLLCKSLKLIPSRYITCKTLIIKEFLQKHHGLGVKVRFPSYLEKYQKKKITSFLVGNGWLPKSTA